MPTITANGFTWVTAPGGIATIQGVAAGGGGNGDDYTPGQNNGLDDIFMASNGYLTYPPGAWSNISVAHLVPPNTPNIHIVGNLILTAGTIQENNTGAIDQDFRCNFAQTGYRPQKETYVWQAILSLFTGDRQPCSHWVTLDANLTFDFWWTALINGVPNFGAYPEYPTVAVHAWIDAIGLP